MKSTFNWNETKQLNPLQILFALYHTFQLWLFPMLVIISLSITLTVYLSKSILPAFALHFIANFILSILGILALVFG